jgi:hypothetical protein
LFINILKVKGLLALREFLNAIKIKISPKWAYKHYINLFKNNKLGLPNLDLKTLKRWFLAIVISLLTKKYKVFTTLKLHFNSNISLKSKGYKYLYFTKLTN